MEPSPTTAPAPHRRRRLLALLAVFALAALVLARPALRLAADKLIVDHGHEERPAELIIVLAGGQGQRVERGVDLWRQGRASRRQILFSGGPIFRTLTWADAMRDYAVQLGVPAEAILLQGRSRTTAEDASLTGLILRREGIKDAILVTDAYHSGRALRAFQDAAPEVRFRSRPVPPPPGDWWTDPEQARFVAAEYLKRLWPGKLSSKE